MIIPRTCRFCDKELRNCNKTGVCGKHWNRRNWSDEGSKFCRYCDKELRSDNKRGVCQEHMHQGNHDQELSRQAARAASRHRFLDSIKLTLGCADCGYREHACALDFDHLPGTVKLFGVGTGLTRAMDVLLTEIDKCEIVCANCHRVRTMVRDDYAGQRHGGRPKELVRR